MNGTTFATTPSLDLLRDQPAWQDLGACQNADPEAWFPEQGGPTALAKDICRRCEVRTDCLEYALENREQHGIWGGLTERERTNLLRRQGGARRLAA